jgi:hypothetical protein
MLFDVLRYFIYLGLQEQNYQYLVQVEVYLARALTPIEGDEEDLP